MNCRCSEETDLKILAWFSSICKDTVPSRLLMFCLSVALRDQISFRHGDVLLTSVKACGHCTCLNF